MTPSLHIAALAIYLASCLYLVVIVFPSARGFQDAVMQRRFLARAFRLQNPLSIGALGVLLMTGAFRLTDLKARLGPSFFVEVGRPLAIKLAMAFLVINIATYVAFGLGHRLVAADQHDLPVDTTSLGRIVRRMRITTWVALALTLLTIWIAYVMSTGRP